MSILSRLFGRAAGPQESHGSYIPSKNQVPPPRPPAELSCFAKGLIKSLETEEWDIHRTLSYPIIRRGDLALSLFDSGSLFISPRELMRELSLEEQRAIEAALEWYFAELDGVEATTAKAKYARLKSTFEKLGCPESA